ncbi:36675_t:CDS:1, partial [Racocetra persica]
RISRENEIFEQRETCLTRDRDQKCQRKVTELAEQSEVQLACDREQK